MNKVIWTDTALAHLQVIRASIEQFNPTAAIHVAQSLRDAGNSLVNVPHRGRLVPVTAMRELATCYPDILRDRIEGYEIVILRIRHTSRSPTNP